MPVLPAVLPSFLRKGKSQVLEALESIVSIESLFLLCACLVCCQDGSKEKKSSGKSKMSTESSS
jgi:hypothetical protein